jgi:uncharacterized protein DUF4824
MTWSRTHTLAAGLALIALTNAVALVGAAYNRSGEPEAKLRLTQRELWTPGRWYGEHSENSGLALAPIWRVLPETTGDGPFYMWRYSGVGGSPAWLDRAKMEALGFETSGAAAPPEDRRRTRYEKQLPREVLLVLELDGAAYRRALELVTEQASREEAKLAANPGVKELAERVKNAREALEWEKTKSSRLFVVDAGLDADALRARYPDRARYAVVRGEVRPAVLDHRTGKAGGYVDSLAVASINVPFRLRDVFGGGARLGEYDDRNKAPFEAVVVYGRRLEPWIVEAAKK